MITSKALYCKDGSLYRRNYAAMSFYLINAFECGLKFSFLPYAESSGIEFTPITVSKDYLYSEAKKEVSSDAFLGDYNECKCLVCGEKSLSIASVELGSNLFWCESDRCNEVAKHFMTNLVIDKELTQTKAVANICGITPLKLYLSASRFKYSESVGLAMLSVFSKNVADNKVDYKTPYMSLREVELKHGVKACTAVITRSKPNLYGAKFPQLKADNQYNYSVLKKDFYEWAKACNRPIKGVTM